MTVKKNNSVHEKLICRGIVSILLILTSLFHSCAVHPGGHLVAVLSKCLQTELLWPVKLLSTTDIAVWIFFSAGRKLSSPHEFVIWILQTLCGVKSLIIQNLVCVSFPKKENQFTKLKPLAFWFQHVKSFINWNRKPVTNVLSWYWQN